MAELVLQELEHGLLTLTLNIAERRNALSTEVALMLLDAVQRAASDPAVRAVLLRGAGSSFCVGGDVKNMASGSTPPQTFESKLASLHRTTEISRILHEMPKPVVAAINGAAAGAGLSLALACDFRVAGENAKLTTAFAKVGMSGDYGAAYFLTKMLGSAKARELLLLSPVLSGREAHTLGLVTRAVLDAEVGTVAHELAMSLARGPTITLGYIKKNINNAERSPLDVCLEAEALHQCRCLQTEDQKEAAAAFVQKRAPEFAGR